LDVAPFILAQLIGALAALYVCRKLLGDNSTGAAPVESAPGE
jgi:hypothetical protein